MGIGDRAAFAPLRGDWEVAVARGGAEALRRLDGPSIAQRGFQVNARTITAANETLQELANIVR